MFGAVNIMLLLFYMFVVGIWQYFLLHVSVAYLLHVASFYNPIKIGRCIGNGKGLRMTPEDHWCPWQVAFLLQIKD